MNLLIVMFFILNICITILTMSLIVSFINNKPILKRNVQDQILVDLAMVTLGYVILYSTSFIVREILGPLGSVAILNTVLLIQQCVFNIGFNCVISLEVVQLCNIFSVSVLNDWPEPKCIRLHRILTFTIGVIIGSTFCLIGGGRCQKTSLYYYFINSSTRTETEKLTLLSGISWISYALVIVTFQICIEVKRFFLNRVDQRADNLALAASKQLHIAITKFKNNAPIQLEKHTITTPDTQNTTQCLSPPVFQHLKRIERQNKDSEIAFKTNFGQCQTGLVDQHSSGLLNEENTPSQHLLELKDEIKVLVTENLRENNSFGKDGKLQVVNKKSDSISFISVQHNYDEIQSSSHSSNPYAFQAFQNLNQTDRFQDDVSKFKCSAPVELKAYNLMIPDTKFTTQNLNPTQIVQHSKARRVQNKVCPDSETTLSSSISPKIISLVDQQEPSDHVIVQQCDLAERLESVQTESWEVLSNFQSIKKSSKHQVNYLLLETTFLKYSQIWL